MPKNTFDTSIKRKCVKYSFVCGNFFFVFASLVFTIFLYSYTIHSDACDGTDIKNTTCLTQLVTEGYKGTQALVDGGLLPIKWTKVTNGSAIVDGAGNAVNDVDGNPTFNGDTYQLCEWNTEQEKCLESQPSDPKCASEFNDDGSRKNRWGTDGDCISLKAPEICKKTGFKDASTSAAQEKIATLGYTAWWAGAVLLITFILSAISTVNMYWDFLTSITCGLCGLAPDDGVIKNFCIEYGAPFKCCDACPSFGLLCNACQSVDSCKPYCKKNKVTDGGYRKPYEAGTIVLGFLAHSALIIYFGKDALETRNTIEKECYGAEGAPYATDALDFIKTLTDLNALQYYDSRGAIDVLMVIGYWGVLITTAMELVSYCLANPESEDMECFALRHGGDKGGACGDLNPFFDISVGTESPESSAKYSRVNTREMYSTRTVQLRGQF